MLVVDDDPQARELYSRLLSDRFPGFPIVAAEDGQSALDWLQSEAPSLVVLDLSMPRVDGFTVLERLRADPRTRTTPVFVLTGRLLSYEDIKRLDYPQVVAHSKEILNAEETLAGLERVFAGSHLVAQPTSLLVKQALGYIQRNYPHTLSRGEISAAVGVSEDYLSRIFSREMGLSPWEYLNRLRVLQAKRLLADSKESVTWIAAQVGFDDPAYFSRVFQKLEGCSPREYRARADGARQESPVP
jgi:YesN/AraC family two-component response regulator